MTILDALMQDADDLGDDGFSTPSINNFAATVEWTADLIGCDESDVGFNWMSRRDFSRPKRQLKERAEKAKEQPGRLRVAGLLLNSEDLAMVDSVLPKVQARQLAADVVVV